MKKRILILLAIFVVGTTIYLGRGWFKVGALLYYTIRHANRVEARISSLTPEELEQLKRDAEDLVSRFPEGHAFERSDKAFPMPFAGLKPYLVTVQDKEVRITMMGGIDHRGIVVRKANGKPWTVYRYDEVKETPIK